MVRDALPVPAWLEGRGGQPEGYCHRQMLDAIFYVTDNTIKWRAMSCDFPAWDRVYAFFRRWRKRGLAREFHDRLRGRVREAEGRRVEPAAGIIDRSRSRAPPRCPPRHVATTVARRSTEGAGTSSRTVVEATAKGRHKTLGVYVPVWGPGPCHNPDCREYLEAAEHPETHDRR
ncbi:transposase [Streptomyces wuyuanensis]|uniref:transposase n=1 Tax=Streptomyces wuyuanensis TaxID=1196353 RepID=UPI00371F4EFD